MNCKICEKDLEIISPVSGVIVCPDSVAVWFRCPHCRASYQHSVPIEEFDAISFEELQKMEQATE